MSPKASDHSGRVDATDPVGLDNVNGPTVGSGAVPQLKTIDVKFLDALFGMEGGYVLDFSNRTFSDFFVRDLGIDIDHPTFAQDGESKAKRLRCFLRLADGATAHRALGMV